LIITKVITMHPLKGTFMLCS